MKPYLIAALLLIITIAAKSQVIVNGRYWNRIRDYLAWDNGRFSYQLTAPNSKISIDSGSIAFKENKFWGRNDTGWVSLSSSSILTTVPDTTARDAIPSGDRYEGMIVYVADVKKYYSLKGGITNDDWVEFTSGGPGGGSLIDDF